MPMVNRHQIETCLEEQLEMPPASLQFLYLQIKQIKVQWSVNKSELSLQNIMKDDLLLATGPDKGVKYDLDFYCASGFVNIYCLDRKFNYELSYDHYGDLLNHSKLCKYSLYPFEKCRHLKNFFK
jgi:hypothetical protein